MRAMNVPKNLPATSAAKPRGRPRSEASATAVLDAAYRLCAAGGLRDASIQAIAAESGVSKMTIYKWWSGRLPLLVDAYLRQATLTLPISGSLPPAEAIHAHAQEYLAALQGELGRVQLAVLAECLSENGNADLFAERYLSLRRSLGASTIRRGQRDGSVHSTRPAEALYDQIYGTMFYRFLFGFKGLNKGFVRTLVDETLLGNALVQNPPSAINPP